MGADPFRRGIAPVAFGAGLALAAVAAGAAAPDPSEAPTVRKPARVFATKSAPTHAWHDGAVRRPLELVGSLVADFSPAALASGGVLRPAGASTKAASTDVSPVLRDETGALRALPGGVLVVLAAPMPEAAARASIAAEGATPVRALTDTLWLVEGPVGLGSLELANRLHASGRFASSQPNWWVRRTLK